MGLSESSLSTILKHLNVYHVVESQLVHLVVKLVVMRGASVP